MVIREHFSGELHALRERLLEMASASDSMVGLAIQALSERNPSIAEQVIAADDVVDRLDIEIEAECLRLIAQQQPVARDLRFIGTAMKVITDLERIGDHAVDIAKVARKLALETWTDPLVDLPRMASVVRRMLGDVMIALVNHDLAKAESVVRQDDEVDLLFHQIGEDLYATMSRNGTNVVRASYLLFAAHYLERIADHIVNIAERIHFVERGELHHLAPSHGNAS